MKVSFEMPEYTGMVDAMGTLRILEAVRFLGLEKKTRIYQASTSELYGKFRKFHKQKLHHFIHAHPMVLLRCMDIGLLKTIVKHGLHASSGILFNHESPRRGETFVTRKITQGLSRISVGLQNVLYLGNLDAKRDWGHAKDYVKAMWMMLQQDEPDDYVIATGKQYSVRDFVEEAAPYFGFDIEWMGSGTDEIGIDRNTKRTVISVNQKYFRPQK